MKAKAIRPMSLLILVFMLAGMFWAPVRGSAQGRGRGQAKKTAKFVNGHDARNGRWDGRGPRRRRIMTYRLYRPSYNRYGVWTRRKHKNRRLYHVYRLRRF